MLKQIKTLGLALVVGCMMVGCSDVESTKIEDTKTNEIIYTEFDSEREQELANIFYDGIMMYMEGNDLESIDEEYIHDMIAELESISNDPYGHGLTKNQGRLAAIKGCLNAYNLDMTAEEILNNHIEKYDSESIEEKELVKEETKVEEKKTEKSKVEEKKTEKEESKIEAIEKPKNKKERNALVRTIITEAIEEGLNANGGLLEMYVSYHKETGKDYGTFLEEIMISIHETVYEEVETNKLYSELDITEKEVAEIVAEVIGYQAALIDEKDRDRAVFNSQRQDIYDEMLTVEKGEPCLSYYDVFDTADAAFREKYYEMRQNGELLNSSLDYTNPSPAAETFKLDKTKATMEVWNTCDEKIGMVEFDLDGNITKVEVYK